MARRKYPLPLTLGVIIVLLGLMIYVFTPRSEGPPEILEVSCIYRKRQVDEVQMDIKLGLDQATREFQAEVREVTFAEDIAAADFIALMDKEIEGGADALVVEAPLDVAVKAAIEERGRQLPIVEMNGESAKVPAGVTMITADYYQIAQTLVQNVDARIGVHKAIVVTGDGNFPDEAMAHQGFNDALKERGVEIVPISFSEAAVYGQIIAHQRDNVAPQVLFVQGTQELAYLADLWEAHPQLKKILLVGIGKSNDIIAHLESGTIDKAAVVNAYGIGYLAVENAVKAHGGEKTENRTVGYILVDKNNLFSKENQRLLFPLVQ